MSERLTKFRYKCKLCGNEFFKGFTTSSWANNIIEDIIVGGKLPHVKEKTTHTCISKKFIGVGIAELIGIVEE